MKILNAAKKRQSPRTKFIHLDDTVPIFENFCFAMALLRSQTVEGVMEGKELIERLIGFQTPDGNFPIHLHEFPKCYDSWMGLKVAPVLKFAKADEALEKVLQNAEQKERPPLWEHRYQSLQKEPCHFTPKTDGEWYHWLISEQLTGADFPPLPYYPELQVFISEKMAQEKYEPRPHPIEWILGVGRLSDHPSLLHAALLFPIENPKFLPNEPYVFLPETLLWKGSNLHSLSFPNGTLQSPNTISFTLSGEPPQDQKTLIEAALFCNISDETEITIDGKKGSVFYFGDSLKIATPTLTIQLRFYLSDGTGDFCGQILRANRPSQISKEPYQAYDWQIALRTLRRTTPCKILTEISLQL